MDSIVTIENEIKKAKERRKSLIMIAMDGRSQRYVSEKTNIDETKLSRWINSEATLEDSELKSLTAYLGVDFK
ncbi:MAG: helix-turn-helix transcriptional regulator [Ferruginibacter sp.]|jgi:hypothetical protein